jgi:dienelactone hydrolase
MRVPVISLFISLVFLVVACKNRPVETSEASNDTLQDFMITKSELTLKYSHAPAARSLSFHKVDIPPEQWKTKARAKLKEILMIREITPPEVTELRKIEYQGITIHALLMKIDSNLTIPAYLLTPDPKKTRKSAVMAIHGHGEVEPVIGLFDDYHHFFGLELAKDGHLVLAPELRGFSTLKDLAEQVEINRLDYWIGRYSQFTLVTDGFLYGNSLIGETVEDLLRWEEWFSETHDVKELDVAGISYGGDLTIIYPVFSDRVRRIFASGTLGSFSVIFQRCYNAPAHCIPGILEWMDRSDIAGLNAPRPIVIHYGELDIPSPTNASASYNETVPQSMEELKAIYRAFGAEDAVRLVVTTDRQHEMDIPALLEFFDHGR